MKIAMAQVNPIVGDIAGNRERAKAVLRQAKEAGTDLVVFGELSLCGYPPRDLVRKEQFVADCQAAAEALARECKDISALVGFVRRTPGSQGRPLQNVAALLTNGRIGHVHVKTLLPTYDVFDETRYFEPGDDPACFEVAGRRIGLSICEDLWDSVALGRSLYGEDPIELLVRDGADVIINMAASPYHVDKAEQREDLFVRRAREHSLPIVYVNQVGGNDELIFDGCSCAVSGDGTILGRARSFEEDLLVVDVFAGGGRVEPRSEGMDGLSRALKLGLKDYIRKCGFNTAVLGLSGGIDSAVVAVLAADALGPANVCALAMPSRYSSDHSLSDAETLARNLDIGYRVLPIDAVHKAYDGLLEGPLADGNREIADENIQARIRGNLVMAFSNAFGHLALATGNKSELSVGYCTLYGDMCGGLAPIGDVLKTVVFDLARQLNEEAGQERIPESILTKPPSAELKPDQFDQDKLPPYELLDQILRKYIEEDLDAGAVASAGFDPEVVRSVIGMVDASEYKRKQAAQVLKVSPRAFGQGRRMPIAQRYVSSSSAR